MRETILPAVATGTRAHEPLFRTLTTLSLAILAVTLAWSLTDDRLLGGVPVWVKPAKFALSFAVHFGTLAVIVSALSPDVRNGRAVRVAGHVMAFVFLAEMGYLFFQAARAEPSHFNMTTTFHAVAYQLMGVGAVLLIAMPVVIARAAKRDEATYLGPATLQGIWMGALLSFGLTLVVAGYMSGTSGHFVGVPSPDAPSLPLFGWSAEVGDLRPAHFLSLHAFQALPLVGLWADRRGHPVRLVNHAAALWILATGAVFAQAVMGLPLIRF